MSSVNFLEKLLDGENVELKSLGEISTILNGFAFESSQYSEEGIRVVRISDVQKGRMSDKDLKFYPLNSKEEIHKYLLREDDLVMSLTGNVGRVAMISKNDLPAALNQRVACIRSNSSLTSNKYLYHFFDQISFENDAMTNATGAGQKNMSTKWLSSYKIPIPCPDSPKKSLEIQTEIVRILDAMTAHTAELSAELTARKKQYNYYRDKLLSFEDGEVEWKKLGEVADIQRGASPRPIANYMTDDENGVPWIKIGDTVPGSKYVDRTEQKVTHEGANKSRVLNPGDFIMSNSMSFGRPYILNIRGAIHDGWAAISNFNRSLDNDYLYHYLSSDFVKKYWESKINSGSVSNLNADIIKSLPVPIPEIQRQKQIAALLDKFDALTASITEGLPREIELRQKQYAYYRDLLLSFPQAQTA